MLASFEHHVGRCWLHCKLALNFVKHHATLLGQQCCMMLASFEQALRFTGTSIYFSNAVDIQLQYRLDLGIYNLGLGGVKQCVKSQKH